MERAESGGRSTRTDTRAWHLRDGVLGRNHIHKYRILLAGFLLYGGQKRLSLPPDLAAPIEFCSRLQKA